MHPSKRRDVLVKRIEYAMAPLEKKALLYEKCRRDPVFWVNYFGWTYDPRPHVKNHKTAFILYDFQEDALRSMIAHIKEGKDVLLDKSRDMGATWIVLYAILHQFMFTDGFSALLGSRKEDLVDNGQLDSLFGKLEFAMKLMPKWMLPAGFQFGKHRHYMKIGHPNGSNSIIGESTNKEFSRSGRYSCIFLDEFAFVDDSQSIWMATGDSSPCRIPVSTPNGKGNKFYDLRFESNTDVISLHWSLHPLKTEEWYKKECERRTDEEVAQELDISYERSTRGRVYGPEVDSMKAKGRIKSFPYNPNLPVQTSWDFGIGDSTAIGFYQVNNIGEVAMIDYYENHDVNIEHYVKIVKAKPYEYSGHYGDVAGKQRSLSSGRSVIDDLRYSGIGIVCKRVKKLDGINAAKKLLATNFFINEVNCRQFIKAIENYHFPYDETNKDYGENPVHDWSSHAADQLEYFAINYRGVSKGNDRKVSPYVRSRVGRITAY